MKSNKERSVRAAWQRLWQKSLRKIGPMLLLVTGAGMLIWGLHDALGAEQAAVTGINPNTQFLPIVANPPAHPSVYDPVVFVSRQIPDKGSVYYHEAGSLPGVGPYDRFRVAAPGKLLVREPNGQIRVLIDGSKPTPATYNLIDVNAPDVSYDGSKIVFAGLPAGNYDSDALNNPGAWRLFTVNVDGTELQQVTYSDQDDLDLSQFESMEAIFRKYDDTDPVWLPDGRIVFSSTRWPAFGQYSGARTSNLYVVNADGSNLHRITAERNGAERPMVDPITGKIVFARWWRNHRFAVNSMETVVDPDGGYVQHEGLTRVRGDAVGNGNKNLQRNAWHLATINPDGTGLALWATNSSTFGAGEDANHAYGGAFTPDGTLYANYFPMRNMTEAAGFGGIRRYERGPGAYTPVLGITDQSGNLARVNPPSYGVYQGSYAAEPTALPNGQLITSWASDVRQDYGLYVANTDGSGLSLLYDLSGTTETRAKVIRPRPLPPIISDSVIDVASLVPPLAEGPYDIDGTFTFHSLNVYFNAPVDTEIVNAPPVGSAGTIRFYIDHQRLNPGSFPNLDWPILLNELPINPDGSVIEPNAPANVPLFEQIRTPGPEYEVPLTGRAFPLNGPNYVGGAAHVAGMNYGRPNTEVRCVGCHTGHTMIPVPESDEAAQWTNLAPGAAISVSSSADSNTNEGLIDRKVMNDSNLAYWRSAPNQNPNGQWVKLTFPVPVSVRTVRLYNPRPDGQANASVQVHSATIRLYSDEAGTVEVANKSVNEALAVSGTDVHFNDVKARVVYVRLNDVSGTFQGVAAASLAEIEVIARGEAAP